jgi:ubiquinone/menaquinone biosynthesis C-methylase UbiE
VSELKQIISEKILCFKCDGILSFTNDYLVCNKCSTKYWVGKNSIAFDDLGLKTQYGRQFGENAQNYELDHSLNEAFSIGFALTFKKALEKLITLPVHCALELGCGTGVLTRGINYHRTAQYILATDISTEMLEVAVNKETSDNVIYLVQDACKLNIKDSSFDVVFGGAILHHLPTPKICLSEVFRVLTPKGVAIFQEPLYYGNQFIVFLMSMVLENLKLQRKYSRSHLHILEKKIHSYSDVLQFMHENRYTPEKLIAFDDKHQFVPDDLISWSKEAGFKYVGINSPWLLNPSSNIKVWREITIEILEALRHESGLEKLRIDYSKIIPLDMIDSLLGSELLEHISPQGIIICQK